MHRIFLIIGLAAAALFSGCIKNDLPYPRIPQNITALEAVGESKAALLDSTNLSATVYLSEDADIENVSFKVFDITPGATASPDLSQGVYDLSSAMVVTLSRYQDYQWVVRAKQDIERYFTIEGQIGETVIDVPGRRIIVSVPETANLSKLNVTSIKLGPKGITTLTPEMPLGEYNFSKPFSIEVTAHGRTEEWTIYVEKTVLLVNTSRVDAWSQVVWAYGECPSDMKGAFQYRRADSQDWINVPASDVKQTEGAFSACIAHLQPLTEYVVRAYSGKDFGNEIKVTTEATADIPDGDFDQWWLDKKVWCPWNEGGVQYWDTGNTGAATLGQSNVFPTDDTPTGSGKAAQLETRFVGIGSIGKLAAGSIYTGKFAKVDGTNGILDFGRPWTLRPTKLKGYYKYKTAPINYTNSEWTELKNRPDSCHIYVALTDWTAPFEIRTNPKNRQLFDKNSPAVIAYGELIFGGTMEQYREFEIVLQYRSTSRVPSYMQITAAASKYGDYFTGGTGAVLLVDQFSFSYDY